MSEAVYARIRSSRNWSRGAAGWLGGLPLFVLFYALVLMIAFAPSVIGERVAPGSTLSVGVAAGLFEFVFFWLLMAYYVRKANSDFDALTAEIVDDAVSAEVIKDAA